MSSPWNDVGYIKSLIWPKSIIIPANNHTVIARMNEGNLVAIECPDLPLMTTDSDGTKRWFKLTTTGTVLHREGGPAIEREDDLQIWYKDGEIHRDNDLPAVINNTTQVWYQHGKIHRDGDQPANISKIITMWYKHGKLHRLNGPALITSNVLEQYEDGKLLNQIIFGVSL